jgi:pyridoxine 4-dehydrogenase
VPSPLTGAVPASGTFAIGPRTVYRLGFGALQITGEGSWGPPPDHDEAVRVLRRAVELGVNLIDTAESYGPYISEDLIREALYPYPDGLVIATKCGTVRTGPDVYIPLGRAEFIRQGCEMSLRRLRLEQIDLLQLHRLDPKVPLEEQLGALAEMVSEGKVRTVGLSNVSLEQLEVSRKLVDVTTVQNEYNLQNRKSDDVLDYCERENIGFIPWYPLANGVLSRPGGPLEIVAKATGSTPAQVAVAWLLGRSRVMLPIPGTRSLRHLDENCAAGALRLTEEQMAALMTAS